MRRQPREGGERQQRGARHRRPRPGAAACARRRPPPGAGRRGARLWCPAPRRRQPLRQPCAAPPRAPPCPPTPQRRPARTGRARRCRAGPAKGRRRSGAWGWVGREGSKPSVGGWEAGARLPTRPPARARAAPGGLARAVAEVGGGWGGARTTPSLVVPQPATWRRAGPANLRGVPSSHQKQPHRLRYSWVVGKRTWRRAGSFARLLVPAPRRPTSARLRGAIPRGIRRTNNQQPPQCRRRWLDIRSVEPPSAGHGASAGLGGRIQPRWAVGPQSGHLLHIRAAGAAPPSTADACRGERYAGRVARKPQQKGWGVLQVQHFFEIYLTAILTRQPLGTSRGSGPAAWR